MIRQEWICFHDERSRKHGETGTFKEKPCREVFSEEHGILQYVIQDREMVVLEIIGHLFYWEEWADWIAKTCGCDKIVSYHRTDKPKRLERLYKMTATKCGDFWRFEKVVK
jgi:hypothetical protein